MKLKLLASLLAASSLTAVHATSYNAADEFHQSITEGQVWQYGATNANDGTFSIYQNLLTEGTFKRWNAPQVVYWLSVAKNIGTATHGNCSDWCVQPGQMYMHPSDGVQGSTVRFVAPESGVYSVSAQFTPIDRQAGKTLVTVTTDSETLHSEIMQYYTASSSFSGSVEICAGDHISSNVFNGGDRYYNDGIGLDFVVEKTAERSDGGLACGENTAPVADAGDNWRINPGQPFILNGFGTYDMQTPTQELSYAWEVISGPADGDLTFDNATNINPVVNVNVLGNYEIQLTVTDPQGLSSTDTVLVSINGAPIADAGTDIVTYVGDEVTLTSHNSTDPEGDYLLVHWNLIDKPADSDYALSESYIETFSFTPLTQGTFTFELVVDDFLSTDSDTINITVISRVSYAQQLLGDALQAACNLDKSVLTTKGNGTALCQMIRQSISFAQKGNTVKALDKIDFALARVNGCRLNGAIDTKRGSEMDYVTDCDAQQSIYQPLVDAKSLINQQFLLNSKAY